MSVTIKNSPAVVFSSPTITSPTITGATLTTPTIDSTTTDSDMMARLALLSTPGWHDLQSRRIEALDTGSLLTRTRSIDVEQIVLAAPTGVTASGLAGGGGSFGTGGQTNDFVWFTGGPVITSPKTEPFALAWRAAYQTPEADDTYRLAFFGLGTPGAGNTMVALGEYYAYGSHTHMVGITDISGESMLVTTVAVDDGVLHDWMIFGNGSTITWYRDNVAIYQLTDLSSVVNSPCHIISRGNLGHVVKITDVLFAYAE
jgi:hypothetical protein